MQTEATRLANIPDSQTLGPHDHGLRGCNISAHWPCRLAMPKRLPSQSASRQSKPPPILGCRGVALLNNRPRVLLGGRLHQGHRLQHPPTLKLTEWGGRQLSLWKMFALTSRRCLGSVSRCQPRSRRFFCPGRVVRMGSGAAGASTPQARAWRGRRQAMGGLGYEYPLRPPMIRVGTSYRMYILLILLLASL